MSTTDLSLITVGMVKQPSEHSEFQMSNEDFPALPGAPASFVFSDQSGVLDSVKINSAQLTPEQELAKSAQARKGIQTSPNGESGLPSTPVHSSPLQSPPFLSLIGPLNVLFTMQAVTPVWSEFAIGDRQLKRNNRKMNYFCINMSDSGTIIVNVVN